MASPRIAVPATLVMLVLATSSGLAQADDAEWLRRCEEREDRSDRRRLVSHCDVRVERLRPSAGSIRVDPGTNGGVSIEGWSRNEVEVHARIEAKAESESEARRLASDVRVVLDGAIRAEGPENERDAHWHVSFVVFVPANSDLDVSTHNGPLSVRSVSGRMQLQTHNGPLALRNVGGEVRAQAQNGPLSVVLSGTQWEGSGLDAETRNGPVSLSVPANYNARLETGTVNGPFTSDLPLTVTLRGRLSQPFTATLGRGGPPIRVVTTNGPVHIRSN